MILIFILRCVLFHPNGACLYSVSSASLRVIGWEPTRLYDTVPFTTGRSPQHSFKFAALAMIPSKQQVVSVGLPGPGTNFSVYSTDVKQLQPIMADGEIVLDADDSPPDNNNFNQKSSSPGRLRRSFHEKKSSPLTETVHRSTSASDDDTTSSTSEQLTIYFETPLLETDGFKPKHIRMFKNLLRASEKNCLLSVKRSPPGTPVPTDPTNASKKESDLKSTYTVVKAVSPLPSRKPTTTDVGRPPAATKTVGKAKATVPPLSSARTNKDGLSKKVVHEVTPLVRVKNDEDTSTDKVGRLKSDPTPSGRTSTVCPDDFLPVR